MSKKENLLWEKNGRRFFFDYELKPENSRNNGSKNGSVSVVEGVKGKIIYAASRVHEVFGANGKGQQED